MAHNKEKYYQYDVCHKYFARIHVVKIKTFKTDKKHLCESCEKTLALPRDLDRHMSINTGEKSFARQKSNKQEN